MGRRNGKQAARGAGAASKDPARVKADRVSDKDLAGSPSNAEVPFYLIGNKRSSKYGKVSARRALMKAMMSMRSCTTGFGCAPGCVATITYPLSEEENLLLHSMASAGSDGAEVGADAAAAGSGVLLLHSMASAGSDGAEVGADAAAAGSGVLLLHSMASAGSDGAEVGADAAAAGSGC